MCDQNNCDLSSVHIYCTFSMTLIILKVTNYQRIDKNQFTFVFISECVVGTNAKYLQFNPVVRLDTPFAQGSIELWDLL